MFDGEQMGEAVVALVRSYMEREIAPVKAENAALKERLASLEASVAASSERNAKLASDIGSTIGQQIADAVSGIELPDPKEVDPDDLRAAVVAAVSELPVPQDGKSVTIEELAPVIAAEVKAAIDAVELPEPKGVDPEALAAAVQTAIDALPVPQDGKSVDLDELTESIENAVDEAIAKIELPEPKEVDQDHLASVVQTAVDALPKPEDGKSVSLDDARPIIVEEVERAVAAIPAPKDGENGLNIRSFLIDRDGHLRCIMEDGSDSDLGLVVGKDGDPGERGKDGLGFDDFDFAVLDDDRTIELSFRRGEDEKVFTAKWPTLIYRGVYKRGESYEHGDAVTWAGQLWIAKQETDKSPDDREGPWQLAVKRGQNGKDAPIRKE